MINFLILSQTQKIAEGQAEKVIVSTKMGNLTILPGHTDLITLLEFGFITLKSTDDTNLLVKQGLMSITHNKLLVLADEAVTTDSLIGKEIDLAIESAQKDISVKHEFSPELIQLEKQLRFEMFKKNFIQKSLL